MVDLDTALSNKEKIKYGLIAVFYFAVFAGVLPFVFLGSSKVLQTASNIEVFTYYGAIIGGGILIYVLAIYAFSKGNGKSFLEVYLINPNMALPYLFDKSENFFRKFTKSVYGQFWFAIGLGLIFAIWFAYLPSNSAVTYNLPPVTGISNQIGAIYLSAENATSGEDLAFMSVLLGLSFGIARFLSKGNTGLFIIYLILGLIITDGLFVFAHHAVYQDSEQALAGIAFLFLIRAITVILTGSIIISIILHNAMNMTLEAKTLFAGNEGYLIGILIALLITYLIFTLFYILVIRKGLKRGFNAQPS